MHITPTIKWIDLILRPNFSSKEIQHQQFQQCKSNTTETNSSYQKIQHQSPHKSIIYEQPILSNDYIQVNLEKSQSHPQQMNLRRTTKHNYNEDSGRHTIIHNLNRHKQKEEDTSWSDEPTNNSVKKNKQK